MPRPIKAGLDYFTFDVHIDNKLKLIEAEFGLNGFAVVVKLWQRIYAERGYYCEFDEEVALLFADEVRLGGNAVSEIVRAAIKRGVFDRGMYDKYKILTSHGIQKRYLEGTNRRVRVDVDRRYLLLSEREIGENVYINGVNAYRNSINADRNTQSKVNESKVNKNKLDYIKEDESNSSGDTNNNDYIVMGTFGNVRLTAEELQRLNDEFGEDLVKLYISRMDSYCEGKHKHYGNYCAANLRKWIINDRSTSAMSSNKHKRNRFDDYDDDNRRDYAELDEKILDMMMEDES